MTLEQFDALSVGDSVRDENGAALSVVFRTKFGIGLKEDSGYVRTVARYADAWKRLSK